MSVVDSRALRGEVQHAALRRVERVAWLPVAATVLTMASQNGGEELRGDLVVLLIRRGRMDGDRAGFQLPDVAHEMSLLPFRIALIFAAEALPDQTPYAGTENAIRYEIALDQRFEPGGFRFRDAVPG